MNLYNTYISYPLNNRKGKTLEYQSDQLLEFVIFYYLMIYLYLMDYKINKVHSYNAILKVR